MPQSRRPRAATTASSAAPRVFPAPADRTGARAPVGAAAPTACGDQVDMCEVRCIDAPTVARVRAEMPLPAAVALAAERLKLLGDPTRLRLLAALARADELCVCDLTLIAGSGGATAVSESAVSHALRGLRLSGLVTYRKARKIAYYRLADASTRQLVADLFGGPRPSDASTPAGQKSA